MGFYRAEDEDWEETVELLVASGLTWPRGTARNDLRWWADQVREGLAKRIPNSKALAARWRWTEWAVRKAVSDEAWWQDPYRRENSAKSPRKTREESANAETEERQESAETREPAAKSPRTPREDSATRAEELVHRPPITGTQNDPPPNPPPSGGGQDVEPDLAPRAAQVAALAERDLDAISPKAAHATALTWLQPSGADVGRLFSLLKATRQAPPGLRQRDVEQGIPVAARRWLARQRDAPDPADDEQLAATT